RRPAGRDPADVLPPRARRRLLVDPLRTANRLRRLPRPNRVASSSVLVSSAVKDDQRAASNNATAHPDARSAASDLEGPGRLLSWNVYVETSGTSRNAKWYVHTPCCTTPGPISVVPRVLRDPSLTIACVLSEMSLNSGDVPTQCLPSPKVVPGSVVAERRYNTAEMVCSLATGATV